MNKKKSIFYAGVTLLIASCLIVSGAVFTYLWSGTVEGNTPVLMEYSIDDGSSWNNAEDYDMSFSETLYQGFTIKNTHNWRCANLPSASTVEITFSYDGSDYPDMEGTTLIVYFDDGTTNSTVLNIVDGSDTAMDNTYTLNGGDSGTIYYEMVGDNELMEALYDWDLSTTVTDIGQP